MSKRARDKPPVPVVRKTAHGLQPVAAMFADDLMADPIGCEYDLVKRKTRSNPQLSLYWLVLDRVVKATGQWPTREHLSDELKLACGYFRRVVNWNTGDVSDAPDSLAFSSMTQDEFNAYFETAMAKLAQKIRFDPMAYLEAA